MEAASLPDADPAPPLGAGRYRLLEVLGSGGMANVYRAYDAQLDIQRAIKVLNPNLALSDVMRRRFQDEARTLARLRHPHIVAVHDFGQDQTRLYMVMEYLQGGSLERRLKRRGPLYARDATLVMLSVLSALEEVHRLGVVHRDVKPANILLDRDGTPKLADFGIAHLQDRQITRHGAAVGTWAYMAPEQKSNARDVDRRADIYGAGATLFTLLTNEEPQDLDRAEHHQEALETLPAPLRAIILKATRYRPDERYATVAELRDALTEALAELPPAPPGAPPIVSIAPVERELGVEQFRIVPGTPNLEIHPERAPFPGSSASPELAAFPPGDTAVPVEGVLRPVLDGPTTFELTRRRFAWRRALAWTVLLAAVAFVLFIGLHDPPEVERPRPSDSPPPPPVDSPLDAPGNWTGNLPVRGVAPPADDRSTAPPAPPILRRVPPEEPASEPPPPTFGRLLIRSDPRSDLYIDGRLVRQVDVVVQSFEVPTGAHRVELRSAVGSYAWSIELAEDETRTLCALLRERRACP